MFSAKNKFFQVDFFQAEIDTAYRGEYYYKDEIVPSRMCAVKIAFSDKEIKFHKKSNFRRVDPKCDDFTINFEISITWFLRTASTEFHKNSQGYLGAIGGSNKLCFIYLSDMS